MKTLLIAALMAALLPLSTARAVDWEDMTRNYKLNGDRAYSVVWRKQSPGQDCVFAVYQNGRVEAAIFRGSILEKNLDGQWHLATYSAPNVNYVKEQGLKVAQLYGTMITGMEMVNLGAFNRQCGGLPPL